jgi:hypothetical protein
MAKPWIVSALANAFASGEPTPDKVAGRGADVLGRAWRWLEPLARLYARRFGDAARPRVRDVVRFLRVDAFELLGRSARLARWIGPPPRMLPSGRAATWALPTIATVGDLADWLCLSVGELEWYADLANLNSRSGSAKLGHYRYRSIPKSNGETRLIEIPKSNLKAIQRRILTDLLDRVPVHSSAHGFVKGRSIRTFAASHVGQRVVLRMDLADFFPSITGPRVQAMFRTADYPEPVADLLGGLCTNIAPRGVGDERHRRPHLPQGAPTSPALANICAYRVDCRLAGLARAAGATYTRYSDDLAFSGGGEFERCVERFASHVAAILAEEGFAVNHRKTRILRRGVAQRLVGLTVNDRVNVRRSEFDSLKAILTNCARHGPSSQNRDGHADFRAHLEGRVGFVESIHPARGARLRSILREIDWAR